MEAAEVLEDGRVSKRGTKGCEAAVWSMSVVKEEGLGMGKDTMTRVRVAFIRTRGGHVRNDKGSDPVGALPGLGVRGPYRVSYKCSHAMLSFQARVPTLAENPPSMVTST